jgi:Helix-turn-helix domain
MTLNSTLRARPPDCKSPVPFSGLPSWIADDPNISPTDKVILLTLAGHAWGGKDVCWPSNATIAAKVGRTAGHVKRRLLVLEELGLIHREPSSMNRTRRQFRLLWRDPPAAPMPRFARATARPEALESQEKKIESGDGASCKVTPSPAKEESGDLAATAADLETWREWAISADPGLASFARAALRTAGAAAGVIRIDPPAENVPGGHINEPIGGAPPLVCPPPVEAPAPPAAETTARPAIPRPVRAKGASAAPIPRRAPASVAPSRRQSQHQSPRRLFEGLIQQNQAPSPLEVRITPRL